MPATGEAVVISISKMPVKIADATKLMDSTRDSLLKSVNGTLESEETIPGDIPARRLLFRSGTAFLRARLAADGDRLYVLFGRRTVSASQRAVPAIAQIFLRFVPHHATRRGTGSNATARGTVALRRSLPVTRKQSISEIRRSRANARFAFLIHWSTSTGQRSC